MLGHSVLRAEDLPASPSTPQQACLAMVRESDLVILLLGRAYGARQESGLSATHEEYYEAREDKPVLVFVEEIEERDKAQAEFLTEVQGWSAGYLRRGFDSPAALKESVVRALHDHELATAHGTFDEAECLSRAEAMVPAERTGFSGGGARILLVVSGGPHQQVLRPTELELPELTSDLQRESLFGQFAVLDSTEGTRVAIRGDALVLEQESRELLVNQAGTIRLKTLLPGTSSRNGNELASIIQEDVQSVLTVAIRHAGWILERIDPLQRITDVVLLARLTGASWMPWRSRAEQAASRTSGQMGSSDGDASPVSLTPNRRHRQALGHDAERMAEDLTALLRRQRHRQ